MDRLFTWNEQEPDCNESEFTLERVDFNEEPGCPAGWPLQSEGSISQYLDSFLNPPTQEKGKHQPQHHIEQPRPELDIQVPSEIEKAREETNRTIRSGGDHLATVSSNITDRICLVTKGHNGTRRNKRAKLMETAVELELREDEAKLVNELIATSGNNLFNIDMLRKLFGYAPLSADPSVPFQEGTQSDRLREIAHQYLTSNSMVTHFATGLSKFSNKLKLIRHLNSFEQFPLKSQSCLGLSLSKLQ